MSGDLLKNLSLELLFSRMKMYICYLATGRSVLGKLTVAEVLRSRPVLKTEVIVFSQYEPT